MPMKRYRYTSLCAIALTLTLFLFGCGKDKSHYEGLRERTVVAYFGPDRIIAKNALTAFISEIEKNKAEIENLHCYNYNYLAGYTWLRLASIYESESQPDLEKFAMDRAVDYFDKDPDFIRDKRYSGLERSKRGEALKELIHQAEKNGAPKWKRNPEK